MNAFSRLYPRVQRQTEGLSARFPICCIENRPSYPLRCFAPPPLTIRGGRVVGRHALSIRGGMNGGCDTSPFQKGRHEWWMRHLPFPKGRQEERNATPPLTIRGGGFYYGSLVQRERCNLRPTPWLPCAKGAGCQRQTEGLSPAVISPLLSLPFRAFPRSPRFPLFSPSPPSRRRAADRAKRRCARQIRRQRNSFPPPS